MHGIAQHPLFDQGSQSAAEYLTGQFLRELETGAPVGGAGKDSNDDQLHMMQDMDVASSPGGAGMDVVDSWHHDPMEGVSSYGLEFVCRRPLARSKKRMAGDLNPSFVSPTKGFVQLVADDGSGAKGGLSAAGQLAEEMLAQDSLDNKEQAVLKSLHALGDERKVADASARFYGFESTPEDDTRRQMALRSGLRVNLSVTINRINDMAVVTAFVAPTTLWDVAWKRHGEALVDNCYVNWADASPDKFS